MAREPSVRDKGLMWVYNQAMRMGALRAPAPHARRPCRGQRDGRPASYLKIPLLLIEPQSTDAVLFMHNPASFGARRTISNTPTRLRAIALTARSSPTIAHRASRSAAGAQHTANERRSALRIEQEGRTGYLTPPPLSTQPIKTCKLLPLVLRSGMQVLGQSVMTLGALGSS